MSPVSSLRLPSWVMQSDRKDPTMADSKKRLLGWDDDAEDSSKATHERQATGACAILYIKICLALVVTAVLAGAAVAIVTDNAYKVEQSELPKFHCGKTAVEARALGCKFDIMEFGWVHPECWDQDLLDEYAPPDRWTFSLDRDLQSPVTQELASTGHIEALWVLNDYHGAHCVYVFHKMVKAVALRRPVNTRNRQMVHTHHCSKSIHAIEPSNFNVTGLGGVNYMACGSDYLTER